MNGNSRTTSAILMLGALFFLFGFITWINGPLISYLKIICELDSGAEPFYVTFAFYIAYFFTALPMARILERTGMKNGMMYGLLTMAVGALVFVPAAQMRSYGLFLLGLFVIGTGLSLLQTASNPYITVVGPLESAAARISVMGICNKLAGVLAPLVVGAVLLSDADALRIELDTLQGLDHEARLDEVAARVVKPYLVMAVALIILAVSVRFSPLPELDEQVEGAGDREEGRSVLSYPNLVLGAVALFLYVGVEVMAGDTIGTYGESQGLPLSEAKHLTSYTLIFMVVGYVIGIATIPRFLSQSKALVISAILGVLITLAAMVTDGYTSVLCIALLGLANALVWPAIWPLAIADLGRFTKQASAILIMAIAGGAILPLIYGQLAASPGVGPQMAYAMMLPCYGFMLWYASTGARWRHWRAAR
jgi:glucose/galactose transporter